jgi:hypothetical protein
VQAGPAGPKVTDPWWGAAQAGVAGAGVGGALGLGRALFDKDRRKRWLQEALQGAILGGGIGGGAGLAYHGANRIAKHEGPPKPGPATVWEGVGNAYREGGLPAAAAYIPNDIGRRLGFAPQEDATTNAGAIVGAGLLGTAGFGAGSAYDASRSVHLQQAPVTEAVADHARAVDAHRARLTQSPNLRQDIHNLASSSTDVRQLLAAPISNTNPQRRIDALSATTSPQVTHSELGMAQGPFEALRQRATAHGAGPAPTQRPAQALPTAPWSLRGRVGGGIGGGILGALLGSQGLPRLFSPSNQGR